MTAAILTIGTELTRGELVDSNAAWLSAELTALGFEVLHHLSVDDDKARIVSALKWLAEDHRLVIVTGGLGPTTDDLTTEAAAEAIGQAMVLDPASLEAIRKRWSALGRPMPQSNEKQAMFPQGARVLANQAGTAPGFCITLSESEIYFLPGVPGEMKRMFLESVVPTLAPRAERQSHQVLLRSFGLPESEIADRLRDLELPDSITMAYRAHFPEIEVKVLARASNPVEAEESARRVAGEVRARLSGCIYGERDDTFASHIGRLLRARGLRIAVAESCTGGLIGALLTSVPGSSEYLIFDTVTYANAAKSALLGVSPETLRAHGAVSAETAAAMAEGALRLSEADLAVSVTGIAGPGGGSESRPVGTIWFALARKGQATLTEHHKLGGDRERIRVLASYMALKFVERAIEAP